MKLVKCCEGGFDCDGKIRAAREKEVLQQAAERSFRRRLGRNQEVLAERGRVGRQRIVFSLIASLINVKAPEIIAWLAIIAAVVAMTTPVIINQ